MTLTDKLLETAKRRSIYASLEARQLGVDVTEVRAAIRKLVKAKLITADTGSNTRPFFGAIEKGYRAN